jgi:hypothetical protein
MNGIVHDEFHLTRDDGDDSAAGSVGSGGRGSAAASENSDFERRRALAPPKPHARKKSAL